MVIYKRALAIYAKALWLRLILYNQKIFLLYKMSRKMNRGETMIPKDPVMLLSFVNLKLRDYYSSLDDMCDGLDVSKQEITEKLAQIDYHYDAGRNQFC